jgi:hypothetical protein
MLSHCLPPIPIFGRLLVFGELYIFRLNYDILAALLF